MKKYVLPAIFFLPCALLAACGKKKILLVIV